MPNRHLFRRRLLAIIFVFVLLNILTQFSASYFRGGFRQLSRTREILDSRRNSSAVRSSPTVRAHKYRARPPAPEGWTREPFVASKVPESSEMFVDSLTPFDKYEARRPRLLTTANFSSVSVDALLGEWGERIPANGSFFCELLLWGLSFDEHSRVQSHSFAKRTQACRTSVASHKGEKT